MNIPTSGLVPITHAAHSCGLWQAGHKTMSAQDTLSWSVRAPSPCCAGMVTLITAFSSCAPSHPASSSCDSRESPLTSPGLLCLGRQPAGPPVLSADLTLSLRICLCAPCFLLMGLSFPRSSVCPVGLCADSAETTGLGAATS